MALSSRIRVSMTILMNLVLLMSYLLLILLNRMASWSAKTGLLLRWLALCSMSTKPLVVSGLMQLILRAISSTEYIFTNSSRRLPMNSSLTRNPMLFTSKSSVLNAGLEILITTLNLHRKHMKVLCLVTERTRTPTESSIMFFTRVVETVDVRFDETNGSQREHLPSVLDEPAPEDSIKHKATEDVIPTEESAEEFIPEHEERRADAPEENAEEIDGEENDDQIPQRQPAL